MKRIVSAFICAVMLFTCSTAVFAISEDNKSINDLIANQAENNPEDFNENGVRKYREYEITGLTTANKYFITDFETGKSSNNSVKYNVKFDKLYGIVYANDYTIIPVVASDSKMTVEFTENANLAEHPLFSDKATLSEDGTKWSTAYSGKSPLDLEIYSNKNYVSNNSSIFHKDGENIYSYNIQDGCNFYTFKTVYLYNSGILFSLGVLSLNEKDIDSLRETKTLSLDSELEHGIYSYPVKTIYEMLFGESIDTPEGVATPTTYTTKADPRYVYDQKTGTTTRVDNNIDLTFDECYGTIKIYANSGVLTSDAWGMDPVIEIPVVKANSKMHIDLSNSKYDAEEYNKNNYSSTDYWERRKCWRYAASNDASRADIIVNGGYGVFVNRDEGDSFGYVSSDEMWYRMDKGFLKYVMNYDGDIEAYISLKKVLALDDEQLWELKQFNTISNHFGSDNWTYSFDGLYEAVFNEPAPPTEITNVSADATENDSISVNVDTSCTRGKSVFAVSYKDGAVVDTKDVLGGKATLEGNADNVKVFCWKSLESMIPLCPVGETEVQ